MSIFESLSESDSDNGLINFFKKPYSKNTSIADQFYIKKLFHITKELFSSL